jgi:hypothetical protein
MQLGQFAPQAVVQKRMEIVYVFGYIHSRERSHISKEQP